jgi:hypothetical protein
MRGRLVRSLRRLYWFHIVRYDSEICQDCDRPYIDIIWWAEDNLLWSEVTGWPLRYGTDPGPGLLCPRCFARRAVAKEIRLIWNPVRDGRP